MVINRFYSSFKWITTLESLRPAHAPLDSIHFAWTSSNFVAFCFQLWVTVWPQVVFYFCLFIVFPNSLFVVVLLLSEFNSMTLKSVVIQFLLIKFLTNESLSGFEPNPLVVIMLFGCFQKKFPSYFCRTRKQLWNLPFCGVTSENCSHSFFYLLLFRVECVFSPTNFINVLFIPGRLGLSIYRKPRLRGMSLSTRLLKAGCTLALVCVTW